LDALLVDGLQRSDSAFPPECCETKVDTPIAATPPMNEISCFQRIGIMASTSSCERSNAR